MHYYYVRGCGLRNWMKIGDVYQATGDIIVVVRDETGLHYEFTLVTGFQCNGGSVPWCFQWFVPGWSATNDLLNTAYALHDAMYCSGFIPRDLADDMLRGLLRDAGLSRLRASTVCYAVNKFAESHYNKDEYNSKPFVKMRVFIP